MFNSDPTLYGATLPQREFPSMNPYVAPWAMFGQQFPFYGQQLPFYGQQFPFYGQQLPFYGQQLPYPMYGQQFPWQQKYVPIQHELYPQNQSVYGNRFFGQVPYPPFIQGYGMPQFKWQTHSAY